MKIKELFPDVLTEDLSYEFKARLNPDNPIKWAKALVAFSNGDGGYIFVGVNNQGEAFGLTLDEIDETKNLVALINDRHIFPHAKYSFRMRNVNDEGERFVLGIQVFPSDSIVTFKDGDFRETVFIKGDANALPANPAEIISLSKRKYGVDNAYTNTAYEENLWKGYSDLCKEYREDRAVPAIEELQSMEIVSNEGYASSGLEMFKDDYSGDDTLIHCRVFLGKNKAAPVINREELKGSLAKTFKEALEFMSRYTKHGYYKKGMKRINVYSYPKIARREALVNAIAHRDYSIRGTQIDINIFDDRIEITSPGSWMLPKSFEEYESLRIPSVRRNQIICACFDVANLMERGGTGFRAIWESYDNQSPEKQPFVSTYPGFFIITLPEQAFPLEAMNDEEIEASTPLTTEMEIVLNELSKSPASIRGLQALTAYKSRPKFILNVINPLLAAGKIERIGNPKSKNSYFVLKKD